MLANRAEGLQKLCVVVPVNGALIHHKLAVNVLAVNHVAVTVKLIGVPLRAEGDEHRERTEVIYMVENGSYAQRDE